MVRFANKNDEGYQQVLGELQHVLSSLQNVLCGQQAGAGSSSQATLSSAFCKCYLLELNVKS
jgi:hypothetical protein